jgi:di/tricarboxylate transporter
LSQMVILAIILAVTVVLFISNRLPVVVVAMLTTLALWMTGILTIEQSLSGFGDPAVIFIATLFIISAGLEATGVTAWAGQLLIRGAGETSRTRLLVLMMLLVAFLTALISVNGAVAALLPVVVVTAVRLKRHASQLLMPMVFAAHAGSLLALTGTPVNVLVSEASNEAGAGSFGVFEFALVGVPLLIGTMLIIIIAGKQLLPHRDGASMPADFSRHARTLVEQYGLATGINTLRVRAGSSLVGQSPTEIDTTPWPLLAIVAVHEGDYAKPLRRNAIAAGDQIIVKGESDLVAAFASEMGLTPVDAETQHGAETLYNRRSGLAEVMVPPRSGLIDYKVFPGMVTESGDLIIVAVNRAGEDLAARLKGADRGSIALQAGDTLLLQGTWKALDTNLPDPDVLIVSSPDLVRRQALPMGPGAAQALIALFGMVILLTTGLVPPAVAGLLAAGAIILSGIMTVQQSYRAVEWTTVVLVAALMPLSTAMVQTGAADYLASELVRYIGTAGPFALLAGLFVMTAVMGQLISNTATALIVIPIGVAAATAMGISPRPVLMSTAVAAAAAFITPIATPTNLMVMGPGGYVFGDYWKLGLPLMVWFFVVSVFLVPLIWTF